ncbi:hypothetical protein E0H78_12950 [Acinetobacter sp. ANC 4641]|nr:hypothetical protein E0H78_12950 [Acinetobacter sp. ANC 4641]
MANPSKPFVTDWENLVPVVLPKIQSTVAPVSANALAALILILVLVQKRLYQHNNPAACQAAS